MKSYYSSTLLVLIVAVIVMALVSDLGVASIGGIMFDDIGAQHVAGSYGDNYAFRHEHISPEAPAA
jgi:hypothetical protein